MQPLDRSLTSLPQIEHRIDSLYDALDLLIATGQHNAAALLAQTIYPYWEIHDYLSEGVEWLTRALGQGEDLDADLAASLYTMLGNLTRHQSDYQQAEQYYGQAMAYGDAALDHTTHTTILSGLGEIAFRRGDYDGAVNFYQNHLSISRQAEDGYRVADAVNGLGRLATVQHRFTDAVEYHDYGQLMCQQQNYPSGLAWSFNAVGELERAQGRYTAAIQYFSDSAALFNRVGNRGALMLANGNLAFAQLRAGQFSKAHALLTEVMQFWRRGSAKHGIALCYVGLGWIDAAQKQYSSATLKLAVATELLRRTGVSLESGDKADYEDALVMVQATVGEAHYQDILCSLADFSTAQLLQVNSHPSATIPAVPTLTRREVEILSLVAEGLTDKEIAARAVVSPHTVNAHLRAIYRKLDANTRTAAVKAARQHDLL